MKKLLNVHLFIYQHALNTGILKDFACDMSIKLWIYKQAFKEKIKHHHKFECE